MGSKRPAARAWRAVHSRRDPFILAGTVTNLSLIAKGTLDGRRHGLLYRPATTNYVTDQNGFGPFTHAELIAKVTVGDTLTVMGVPLGSGSRLGLDRDGVGDWDGDIVPPPLRIALTNGIMAISWTNAGGVVLEVAESLSSAAWQTDPGVRETIGNDLLVTHALPNGARFYRLRGL